MAIGDNSYGSVAEVEALVQRYTNAGSFDAGTRPTATQVEKMIDRVSGIVNVLLAEAGFAIPVSQADAKLALDDFVVNQTVQLAHAANGAGPFAPGSEQLRTSTPMKIIIAEAAAFILDHAEGFEALGATRDRHLTYGLGCRLKDAAGDDLVPPFHREMIGHKIVDWDQANE
jgi:hypothetical protein